MAKTKTIERFAKLLRKVRVGRQGIRRGGATFNSPNLTPYIGTTVLVPAEIGDLDSIPILGLDEKAVLCVATRERLAAYGPLEAAARREAVKRSAAIRRQRQLAMKELQ